MRVNIGVLAMQGDIEEHHTASKLALERKGWEGEIVPVKSVKDAQRADALIIPGGESTVIGGLSASNDTLMTVKDRLKDSMPVLGTCAGMIILAKRTYDRVVGETNQPLLGAMDIVVERNTFGRQRESFEADLKIPVLGAKDFRGVFIRSPSVKEVGPSVQVLTKLNNMSVAVQQGNMIATAFHPELSGDTRLHEYFLDLLE